MAELMQGLYYPPSGTPRPTPLQVAEDGSLVANGGAAPAPATGFAAAAFDVGTTSVTLSGSFPGGCTLLNASPPGGPTIYLAAPPATSSDGFPLLPGASFGDQRLQDLSIVAAIADAAGGDLRAVGFS